MSNNGSIIIQSLGSQLSVKRDLDLLLSLSLPLCVCYFLLSLWKLALSLACLYSLSSFQVSMVERRLSGNRSVWWHLKFLDVFLDPFLISVCNLQFCHPDCPYCNFTMLVYSVHMTSISCLSVLKRDPSSVALPEVSSICFHVKFFLFWIGGLRTEGVAYSTDCDIGLYK